SAAPPPRSRARGTGPERVALPALRASGRSVLARPHEGAVGVRPGASRAGAAEPLGPRAAAHRLSAVVQPPDAAGATRARPRVACRARRVATRSLLPIRAHPLYPVETRSREPRGEA